MQGCTDIRICGYRHFREYRRKNLALYEVVPAIETTDERNQMRDVFFDEIETDDPVAAVRSLLKGDQNAQLRMEVLDGERLTVYAQCSGITQKFLFTKI